jgi:hypothetical protein
MIMPLTQKVSAIVAGHAPEAPNPNRSVRKTISTKTAVTMPKAKTPF